ncbi:hypothetical protein Rhe02_93930 [Rhizocola hellebori]|uniref:Uncharacterized protein n=1 Tax=Rhizocola hellebori TaxID=1392758 RepID=A0A8J3QIM1_9ACTN|nr:hypothetical protein [Rhizocola hellebori]GIH11326.1 hypothetical protein Rhe02_93930 [Rhizocola hellebori]
MRDPSQAPPDFVSYVERRLPPLDAAAHRLTGDEQQAERMARELLAMVALRWRRLDRGDRKSELAAGASADVYLTRLFRQEAGEFGYPQMSLNLSAPVPVRRRSALAGALRPVDEASLIWEAARRAIRRRLILAGVAGGVLGLAALCQRATGSSADGQGDPTPAAPPTVLPTGAERAPNDLSATRQLVGLPQGLDMPKDPVVPISADPVRRALLIVARSRADTSPILVLGEDFRWRQLDAAPSLAALWMQTNALSPDGRRAAFGTSTGTYVIDLTTGKGLTFHSAPETTRPVWLSNRHLLLGPNTLVIPQTGEVLPVPEGPADMITPRRSIDSSADPTVGMIELLSIGQPATASARLRRWRAEDSRMLSASIPLNGELTELIGPWRGPGFSVDGDRGFLVRACMPSPVPSVQGASTVIAVVRPTNGKVERALLVDSAISGTVRVIGWADSRRVLLSFTRPGRQQVVTWDLFAGGLFIASAIESDGVLSLPDPIFGA